MAITSKAPGALCDGCPAYRGRLLPPAPAHHVDGPRLVVVGEAPCSADYQNGGVFRSHSGRLLDRELQGLGLRRDKVHLTNAILCDCRMKDRKKARKHCAPRLQAEIAALPPQAPIVTFDGLATQSAVSWPKSTPIVKWRGSVCETGGIKVNGDELLPHRLVLPIIAPQEVQRTPRWRPVWDGDWARVGRVMHQGFTWPEDMPGRELVIARDMGVLRSALARLKPGDVAADIESVGLGFTETPLVCIGFSDGALTVVVPWSRGRDGVEQWWTNPAQVAEEISKMLSTRTMITHNGPAADHLVMRRYGMRWGAWDDTLLMAHATASHMPKDLAHVVTTCGIDVGPWKLLEDRTADLERLFHYNGRDCLYSILAARVLKERLCEA